MWPCGQLQGATCRGEVSHECKEVSRESKVSRKCKEVSRECTRMTLKKNVYIYIYIYIYIWHKV